MRSSDSDAHSRGVGFVADVQGAVSIGFEPEFLATSRATAPGEAQAQSIDAYRPGPTPEEIRAVCREEFEAEFGRRLDQERAADERQLRALSEAVHEQASARRERLGRQCVDLAFLIAERLVRDRIDRDPELIERVVRDAVEQVDRVTDLTVYVNPADAARLQGKESLLAELGIVCVREDAKQLPGGCRLQSDARAWDASLTGQLALVREALDVVLESTQ